MNKKNITIETNFFDDGVDANLKRYHQDEDSNLNSKEALSGVRQYRKQSHDGSINSYRYEYVPDNEYSQQVRYPNSQGYQGQSANARKLQSANQLEDILSRIMANLFIRCWQSLKGILPQYEYLVNRQSEQVQQFQQIVRINSQPAYQQQASSQNKLTNIFTKNIQTNQERKRQILQRQRRGLTLDSLQKQKLNRSKSVNRLQPERDVVTVTKPLDSKETLANADFQERQEMSRVSGKSYRQKFLQYKHRSKSREQGFQKCQTYTKFTHYNPVDRVNQTLKVNQNGHYSVGNLAPRNTRLISSNQTNKTQILRNISTLLLDRQDVYQGQDYKYYINHRDSSKNVYNQTFSYKNLGRSNSRDNFRSYYRPSTKIEINRQELEQEEFMRARLMEQIVEKLNYSKLRLGQSEKTSPDQLEMMRKIARLEKIVLELKREGQNTTQVKNVYVQQSQVKNHTLIANKSQQEELYRRFLDQISSIRSQIKQLKLSKQSSPQIIPQTVPHHESQHSHIRIDNNSSHIISEQQKLLSNYQVGFEKLVKQKQRSRVNQAFVYKPSTQTATKLVFGSLVEKGSSEQRTGWNNRWQVKESQRTHNFGTRNDNSRRHDQYLSSQDSHKVYRYTRNQVLQDIGLKDQVNEEQRLLRQTQARLQLDRERRQVAIKNMTQNVKFRRQQELASNAQRNKPIREKYEKDWEKFQKNKTDMHEDHCCALFPC